MWSFCLQPGDGHCVIEVSIFSPGWQRDEGGTTYGRVYVRGVGGGVLGGRGIGGRGGFGGGGRTRICDGRDAPLVHASDITRS